MPWGLYPWFRVCPKPSRRNSARKAGLSFHSLLLAQLRNPSRFYNSKFSPAPQGNLRELLSPGPLAVASWPRHSLVALSLEPREQGEEVEEFQKATSAAVAPGPSGMGKGQQESQAVMRAV